MTSFAMFKMSCKKRPRTCRTYWEKSLNWCRKRFFDIRIYKYAEQREKYWIQIQEIENQIWFIATKKFSCIEWQSKTWNRKSKIEKMNWKIVRKNSRAWMTKCRMIERLQTIEVWNFIWWTAIKMIEVDLPNDQEAKLIQYLDDYLAELHKQKPNFETRVVWLNWMRIFWIHESIIISKQFWFIYRLSWKHLIDYESNEYLNWYFELFDSKDEWIRASADSIIAILSVNLRPLDFLSSILNLICYKLFI